MTTNPTPKIRILVSENPKKPYSKAWHRFNLYKDGMTVWEAERAGVTRSDLHYDTLHHFIDITTMDNKANGSPGTAPKPSHNRSAAVARIKALLSKTVENGCTEEEASAAISKAGELMDKYGIESSETDIREEVCITGIHGAERLKIHESTWIATELAKYCDCRVWRKTGTGQIAFFGIPADVEVATYIMRVVQGSMDRGWKIFTKSPDYPSWEVSRRVRNTYMASFASRVNARLREMRIARHTETLVTTSGTSLMVVKQQVVAEQFAQSGLQIRKSSGTTSRQHSNSDAARNAGQAAGSKVHLGGAIGGASPSSKRIG